MTSLTGKGRKIAVVLFNLGGPDGLKAVKPFLFNLFRDPAIITLPAMARYPLAALIATSLVLLIVRGALRPLTQARRAAETVAESQDPSLRVPEGRDDEIGGLARSMNRMLARLEDAQGRLLSLIHI